MSASACPDVHRKTVIDSTPQHESDNNVSKSKQPGTAHSVHHNEEKSDLLNVAVESCPKLTSFDSSNDLETSIPKLVDEEVSVDIEETGNLRSKRGAMIAIVSSTAQMIDSI